MRAYNRLFMRLLVVITILGMDLTFPGQGLTKEAQLSPATCIIYVNVNVPGGDHSGSSWTNADRDLYHAINNASAGCEIWVAKGTYTPGANRSLSFFLRKGVAIYGGFIGGELNRNSRDWKNNETILSGDIGVQGTKTDNCWNVVWSYQVTSTAVLDGFTVTLGYADDTTYHYGGGIEIIDSSPTLSNLQIDYNTAYFGGGVDFYNSSPVLTDVDFWNNSANYVGGDGGNGGGLYVRNGSHPTLNWVGIYNNTASRTGNEAGGGGLYNDQTSGGLSLTNVNFHGNSATQGGGGMYNYMVHVTMNRVHFLVNYAAFGAGLFMDGEDGTHSQLIDVDFNYNIAQNTGGKGGGLYNYESNPILVNTYFNQNSAYFNGGGIGNYQSSPTLINTSFSLNTAPRGGGGIYNSSNSHPVVQNSILWGDSAGEIYNEKPPSLASDITIAYSLVQGCNPGGTWYSTLCGANNHNLVDADPLFENPAPGQPFLSNLHLRIGSPAINKGNNTYVIPYPTDMDLQPRVQNGVVDLGPYELLFYPIYLPFTIK